MAVLGIVVTIRGRTPLKKPRKPSRWYNKRQPPTKLLMFCTAGSLDVPLVCKIVLMTSMGVVRPAAKPPATAPAKQCVTGSYFFVGFKVVDSDSYARNWRAVKGTVMESVVGYDR